MKLKVIVLFLIAVGVGVACACQTAIAQPVRWKFNQGDKFEAVSTQTRDVSTRVTKRVSKVGSTVTLATDWVVVDASEKEATIEQTVKSIKILIDNPADPSKTVAIDTANEAKPSKISRQLLKQLQPLMGMQMLVKMSARGEVLGVKFSSDSQQKLADIPSDSWLKSLLDPGTLQAQITAAMIGLPEDEPAAGQSWEIGETAKPVTAVAVNLGKRQLTYQGEKTVDGQDLDVFELSTLEKFDAAKTNASKEVVAEETPAVANFEWSGELFFDRAAGYCAACDNRVTIKTKQEYRDMTIETTVVVDSKFQLTKLGE